jgi:hypothetical protein
VGGAVVNNNTPINVGGINITTTQATNGAEMAATISDALKWRLFSEGIMQ